MKFLKLIPIFFIFFGNFPYKNFVYAEVKNPNDFKVFSTNNKKLSIANVEYYLKEGDEVLVKCISKERDGKIRLSRKEALDENIDNYREI